VPAVVLAISAHCCTRYHCAHCCTLHRHAHHYALSYVLVVALSIVLYRRLPPCIIVHRRAQRRIRSRCHWKLEDGYLVEGSNVGIHGGGGGGDKGADALWMAGLTTVEVDRSVKVRRDLQRLILFNLHGPTMSKCSLQVRS
jgi:hypothetical protein